MKAKQIIVLALCAVLLLGGITAVAYPMVSSWYIANHRSEVGSSYDAAVAAEQNVLDTIRASAVEWNRQLANGEIDPLKPEENGYTEQLVLDGVDAMGYIEIPSISWSCPSITGSVLRLFPRAWATCPRAAFRWAEKPPTRSFPPIPVWREIRAFPIWKPSGRGIFSPSMYWATRSPIG